MLKKIEKPDLSGFKDENFNKLFKNETIVRLVKKSFSPYAYWTKVKHWQTQDIKPIDVWVAIKFVRHLNRRESIVEDENGNRFWISSISELEEFLHQIDMKLGGNLLVGGHQVGDELKNRLLSRGVMEEAIASSQLEGAHTTRKAAKQILLEGRKPKNKDEQMIVNNYQAMLKIENELGIKLDEDALFSLHRVLTDNTLEENEVGRYRTDEDNIVVGDTTGNEIYHVPPKAYFVKGEIKRFIAYFNNELLDANFVHPIIKAIIIHFWFGYLHPFVDGNGRMARALFYWYLLRERYWAFGYLPLSKVIKSSSAQYRDAYLYTEQDDNDLTYFIDYNIKKITLAMKDFDAYAERKWKENARIAKIAREQYQLNDRQIQLLRYYYKNKDATTSVSTHMKIYATSRITAMKDLKQLQDYGFIIAKKSGRIVYYYAADKIIGLFD